MCIGINNKWCIQMCLLALLLLNPSTIALTQKNVENNVLNRTRTTYKLYILTSVKQ